MAVTEKAGGTQTATGGGTEDTLSTVTDAGVYTLTVDLSTLAGGATPDILTLRVYTLVRAALALKLVWEGSFVGGMVDANSCAKSPPIESAHEVRFTLAQDQGTARDYVWSVTDIS